MAQERSGSLLSLLHSYGVIAAADTVQAELLQFACQMEDRIVQKQKQLQGHYTPDSAIESWTDPQQTDPRDLLLGIGKNVTELAKECRDSVVSQTASTDIANLALIVDTHQRKNCGT